MKQTKAERLAASTAVILGIIADKQAMLRSPAASTNVPALAGHRWRLTKAFYNYRWFTNRNWVPASAPDMMTPGSWR